MSGTVVGGKRAAESNKARYGEDFYNKIGVKGGTGNRGNRADKGFGSMSKEKISAAGRKGGLNSKRRKKVQIVTVNQQGVHNGAISL